MLFAASTGTRAAVVEEPRIFMDETEGHKFGEPSGALLNRAQQQNVTDPISGIFDVAIHHGGSRGNTELVRGGDDFHPTRNGKLVGAQLAADAVVQNFSGGARGAAEGFVFFSFEIISPRRSCFF